jgi:hypothetical protein
MVYCSKSNKKLPKNKKIYWEVILNTYTHGNQYLGVCNESFKIENWLGSTPYSWAIQINDGISNAFHDGNVIINNFCEHAKSGNIWICYGY